MTNSESGPAWRPVIIALVLAACRDSGLPDRNLPLADAEHRRSSYEVYQASDTADVIRFDGAAWVAAGAPLRIPSSLLVRAALDQDVEVYVLAADARPYDRLYMKAGAAWTPYARVD